VPGVSGAANVGGGLWRLCRRGRFGRHEQGAHDAAIRRIEQAGAVSLTALQVLLESNAIGRAKEHYEEVIAVVKEHLRGVRPAIEYAATMVQKRREPKTATLKYQDKDETPKIVPTDLTQRPRPVFMSAWAASFTIRRRELYDPIFNTNVKGFLSTIATVSSRRNLRMLLNSTRSPNRLLARRMFSSRWNGPAQSIDFVLVRGCNAPPAFPSPVGAEVLAESPKRLERLIVLCR